MAQPNPFSQEIAKSLAKYGVPQTPARSAFKPSAVVKAPGTGTPQDPLSWFIDILSRPMRAVENIPNQVFNEMAKAQAADKLHLPYNVAGGIGNVLASPFTGFFSNNPNDQPTGAGLIEKGTDVIGPLVDKSYQDTQDNVNPWVKGIGGFGLDVGLDPLTYIPIAGWAGKGTQLVAKGAKALIEGADALTAGSNLGKVLGSTARVANKAAATKMADEAAAAELKAKQESLKFTPVADAKEAMAVYEATRPVASAIMKDVKAPLEAPVLKGADESRLKFSETISKINSEVPTAAETEALQKQARNWTAKQKRAAKKDAEMASVDAQAARLIDTAVPDIAVNVAPNASAAVAKAASEMTLPIGEQFAAQADALGNVSAKLAEIKAATQVTSKAAATVPKAFDAWLAEQVVKAKADPKYTLELFNPSGGSLGRISAEDILRAKNPKLRSSASQVALESTHAKLLTEATGKTPKAATYTQYVAKMLKTTKGKSEFEKLFGVKATEQLSKMNEDQLANSVAHLGEVLKGQKAAELEVMTQAPRDVAGRFSHNVLKSYGIDIPGTNVRRLKAATTIGTPEGVQVAAAIVKGEDMSTAGFVVGVTEAMYNSVMRWLPDFIKNDFTDLIGYKLNATKTGVALKKDAFGKTIGKRPWELNTMDQYTMFKHALDRIHSEIKQINDELRLIGDRNKVIAGYQRAAEVQDNVLKEMRIATNALDGKGVAFHIGIGADKFRMDFVQMYTVLEKVAKTVVLGGKTGLAREVMKIAVMNGETSVPITNLMKAVTELVLNSKVTDEQLLAILKEDVKGATNILNKESGFYRHYLAKPAKGTEPYSLYFKENPEFKGKYYGVVDPARFGEELVATIRASREELLKVIADNEAMVAARQLSEGKALSMSAFEKLIAYANDPTAMAESVRAASNITDVVSETGATGRATVPAQEAAATTVSNAARADLVEGAKDAVKIEDTARAEQDFTISSKENDAKLREKFKELNYGRFMYDTKYAQQLVDATKAERDGFDAFGNIINPVAYAEGTYGLAAEHYIARVLNPLREFFDIRHGAERVVDRFQQSSIQLLRGLQEYNIGLVDITRKFRGKVGGTETTLIEQGFRDIARNVDNPATAEVRKALEPLVYQVFGHSADGAAIESIFIRGGGTLADMEAYMAKEGIDFPFDLSAARDKAKVNGLSEVENAVQQWRDIFANAEDPVQLLRKMYHAGAQMASDKVTASLFQRMSGVWSLTRKPGYMKLPNGLNPKDNPFLSHLPKDSYIDPAYYHEIKQIEKVAMSNRTFGGPIGKFLRENYMPILANWKFGVTVLRPGHHIRNFLSSEMIQYVAEGLKHYHKAGNAALKVLMTHRAYEGVDWLETAKHLGEAKMPTGGDVLFGSKWGDITTDAVYEAAQKKGLMVEYKQSQDVLDEMGSGNGIVKRTSDKLLFRDTFVEKGAAAVAEYQTHYNRLHHFNQILMKEAHGKKFTNWNDLVEYAAKRVRNHHPDSTMLAPGEAKLRAIIPFYTWFRLIMPRVAEGIAMQPGRFMVFPKASFGLATSMGVDPYSIADPFPQDQLFPSFLTSQMTGPVAEINGNYIGASPGIPYIDLLNQFVGQGPIRGVTGMVTPFARIPAELLGGTQWGTGAKIKDLSDYVDSNLPGINYIANITGTSITGSAVSLLSGQGLDTQYAVAAKNKTPFDQAMTASNWLTGLGLQNMSKPNYINYAEIEKRNRAAQDKNNRSPY
jgi:hypothetical protein